MKSQLILLGTLLASQVRAHPAPRPNDHALQHSKRLAVDLNPFRFKLGSKYTPSASVEQILVGSSANYVQSATALVTKLFPGAQFRLVDDHYTSSNGISHVNFKQTILGFDLDNADFNVNVAEDGTIFSYGNSFFAGLLPTTDPLALSNLITPLSALTGVTRTLGLALSTDGASAVQNGSPGSFAFQGVSGTVSAPTAQLVYFQTPAGLVLPAWRVETDLDHDWLVTYINALGTGDILGVVNYVADATYTVFKWPLDNPTEGVRTKEANPEYRKASEFGWQGDGRATYTTTIGNNGFAQGNLDGDDEYIDEARPFSSNQVYDFPYDAAATDPKTYLNASVTQLWYTSNMYHDLLWKLGFTEAAGNFETNNNGAGGKGNDAVILNAQDGSGTNNANFATPPDGQPGRMRMYIFDITNPPRDGAFEAGIVIHEYTHGLSNRLTGGPANSNCLVLPESGGMGEGWSDFFATAIRVKGTDTRTKDYPIGEWAFDDPRGIREYVYSTSLTTNPFKYSSLNGKTEVHAIGAVWATFLYEVLWNLIDKRGNTAANSPTLGAKGAPTDGRYLAMKLVLDGLALQPCNPSFVQARDAILDADKALTGGKNLCAIWTGFAKRGLGSDATDLLAIKTDGYKIPAGVC